MVSFSTYAHTPSGSSVPGCLSDGLAAATPDNIRILTQVVDGFTVSMKIYTYVFITRNGLIPEIFILVVRNFERNHVKTIARFTLLLMLQYNMFQHIVTGKWDIFISNCRKSSAE